MQRRQWYAYLPNGFSLAALGLLASNYFGVFTDLDYTWQIRTGELIVRTGDLQPADHFSYTIAGRHVPDWQWVYDVVLWALWDNLGYGGLRLLKTALVATTLLLLSWRLRASGLRWRGVALALMLAVAVLVPMWNLRPLYCTTLGLLTVSGWLHDHCTGKRPLSWGLPLVMLLWANCHSAVITGQALIAGAICSEWLNRRLRVNTPLDPGALRRLTWVGGLGLVATLASPDPLGRLLYPFEGEIRHPVQRAFVEMQPLYKIAANPPYLTGLVYLVAAAVALSVVLRFRRYRGWEIMLLVGVTLLANTAARGAQDWLLVMLAVGLPHVLALVRQAACADRRQSLVRQLLRLDRGCKKALRSPLLCFQWHWLAAAAALLLLVSLIPALSRQMPAQETDDKPRAAVAYLERHGIGGNFFAAPDYGTYLTWKLGDRARCYVDTRGFYFPPVLLEDGIYVPQLGPEWRARLERVLNEYPTDYFILETTGPRGELWRRLRPVVAKEPVYLDEQTVVLQAETVRRGVQALDVAARGP